LNLIDAYSADSYSVLYRLLKERTKEQSISHKKLPSFDEHCNFINSNPYPFWYLIEAKETVGAIYLTENNEIGVFIFSKYQGQGYGEQAIKMLMDLHPGPFFANVNPENQPSRKMFEKMGAELIQVTYRL
jgi:RimJ/RimL family protein N-acetyltransferase